MTRYLWTPEDLAVAEKALADADPGRAIQYRVIEGAVADIREALDRQARDGTQPWALSHGGNHYTEAQGRA